MSRIYEDKWNNWIKYLNEIICMHSNEHERKNINEKIDSSNIDINFNESNIKLDKYRKYKIGDAVYYRVQNNRTPYTDMDNED